jgi:hypothetical protein
MDASYRSAFEDLAVRTPCCHTDTTLNELDYDWPAGFARFVLEARNPGRYPVEAENWPAWNRHSDARCVSSGPTTDARKSRTRVCSLDGPTARKKAKGARVNIFGALGVAGGAWRLSAAAALTRNSAWLCSGCTFRSTTSSTRAVCGGGCGMDWPDGLCCDQ